MPRPLIPVAAYLAGLVTPGDAKGLALVGLGILMAWVIGVIYRDRLNADKAQTTLNTDKQVDAALTIGYKAGELQHDFNEVRTLVHAARKVSE